MTMRRGGGQKYAGEVAVRGAKSHADEEAKRKQNGLGEAGARHVQLQHGEALANAPETDEGTSWQAS